MSAVSALIAFDAPSGQEGKKVTGLWRQTIHIQCLSVPLCLVLMFSSSEAMVLCIGHDGHVAIEASGSRCCGHLPPISCFPDAHCLIDSAGSAQDDECGPCLDIPISSGLSEAVRAPDFVGWALAHRPEMAGHSLTLHLLLPGDFIPLESNLDVRLLIAQSYFPPLLRAVVLLI